MTRRRFLSLVPVLVFGAIGVGLVAAPREEAPPTPDALLDRPLPEFSLPGLGADSPGLSSARLKGRVALLHVFASWCGTCRAEHPFLVRLAAETDTPIIGINWKDRAGAALLYLDRGGNPYDATGADPNGTLGARLGVTGVPETYVIDRDGRIRYRHIGPLDDRLWESVLAPLLNKLETGA